MNTGITLATILSLALALAAAEDALRPRAGLICSPTVCGSNHNETLVRDPAPMKQPSGGCSPLVCGSNHNETLVRDPAPMN